MWCRACSDLVVQECEPPIDVYFAARFNPADKVVSNVRRGRIMRSKDNGPSAAIGKVKSLFVEPSVGHQWVCVAGSPNRVPLADADRSEPPLVLCFLDAGERLALQT